VGTQHKNIIEINGQKYNAVTGKMVGGSGSIDGFSKKPVTNKPVAKKPHTQAAHRKKTTQKSQTLMRSAVKKPAAKTSSSGTQATISRPSMTVPKARVQTAKHTKQSAMISHFGTTKTTSTPQKSSVVKKIQPLAVKPHTNQHHTTKAASSHSAHSKKAHAKANSSTGSAKMIESALEKANAHELPAHKHKKKRKIAHKLGVSSKTMAVSSAVLAGVLLAGFFAVQNVPNVSMRVAAARAGVNATMPGYNPSGFSYSGPINYSDGQVTISFKSNTNDGRHYNLTQRDSNWNSDALLSNFVVVSNQQYQTYLDRGRTLYIYGGSNATWVDGGVWYQIEGESEMTTDQLVRIAASM
jgi:hypothetical protein